MFEVFCLFLWHWRLPLPVFNVHVQFRSPLSSGKSRSSSVRDQTRCCVRAVLLQMSNTEQKHSVVYLHFHCFLIVDIYIWLSHFCFLFFNVLTIAYLLTYCNICDAMSDMCVSPPSPRLLLQLQHSDFRVQLTQRQPPIREQLTGQWGEPRAGAAALTTASYVCKLMWVQQHGRDRCIV